MASSEWCGPGSGRPRPNVARTAIGAAPQPGDPRGARSEGGCIASLADLSVDDVVRSVVQVVQIHADICAAPSCPRLGCSGALRDDLVERLSQVDTPERHLDAQLSLSSGH